MRDNAIVQVIDLKTKKRRVGKTYTFNNRNKAIDKAEKLNLKYGSLRYVTMVIYQGKLAWVY